MIKSFLAVALAAVAIAASAAVDVNSADQAALESVTGIGPSLSTRIIDERKKRSFSDWPDFMHRVKGIGQRTAAKLSTHGVTVNDQAYVPVATKAIGKAASTAP
jgi:competence protein ComEA